MPGKMAIAKGIGPRDTVLDILLRQEKTGEKLNELINRSLASEKSFDARDRAFIKHLSEGTVERRITLDHVIDRFSNVKTGKMKPVIRNILPMSSYLWIPFPPGQSSPPRWSLQKKDISEPCPVL